MDSAAIHQHLLEPNSYPDGTSAVTFRETHISRVYLTDHFAYKFKKPLDLGFLDFSTLPQRQFFCNEEVTLNRRFAPDTYLDVAVLRQGKSGLRFGSHGRVIDYAVRMHRLPEERMLSTLLDHNDPALPAELVRLGRHLAELLGRATPCQGEETLATIQGKIVGNLEQTRTAIGRSLSVDAHRLMSERMAQELDRLTGLFTQRSACGYVRDGHGDLHAANICMTEPIRVYDCIEFCRRFRVADVAADLAFLLMDLDFRNRRDLAAILLDTYQQHSNDPDLATLLPFYKTYRAWVRGKVNTLLAMETDVAAAQREQALDSARRYFNLALGYHLRPMLIMTAGLMGVGKSTLAKALSTATGARLLRSDVIRKELAGIPADRPCSDPFGTGLYTDQMTSRTYSELRAQAASALQSGELVLVDAAFAHAAERDAFLGLAASLDKAALVVHLQCDRDTTLQRLDRRQSEGNDPSDGRREVYQQQAVRFEDFSPSFPVIAIDSSLAVDYNVQQVLCSVLQS
jgi:hypothetical protein